MKGTLLLTGWRVLLDGWMLNRVQPGGCCKTAQFVSPERLGPGQIRRAVVTMVQGNRVGEIPDARTIVGVTVRGGDAARTDVGGLRALRIEAPNGALVPLGELADVEIVPTPNVIQRESASRKIDVTCNADGRDLGRGLSAYNSGDALRIRGHHSDEIAGILGTTPGTVRVQLHRAHAQLRTELTSEGGRP